MKISNDRGNARALKISLPKQNKVIERIIRGMAGRTAEGLEPSIPYTLIIIKRKKKTPPTQLVPTGIFVISFLLSQIK